MGCPYVRAAQWRPVGNHQGCPYEPIFEFRVSSFDLPISIFKFRLFGPHKYAR